MDIKTILSKLEDFDGKTLEEWITKIDSIFEIVESHDKINNNNYFLFRSFHLKRLKEENPQKTYKENMITISELWRVSR
jgi:hypothetical protein